MLPVSSHTNPERTNLNSYSIRDNLVVATPGSKADKKIQSSLAERSCTQLLFQYRGKREIVSALALVFYV